METSEQLHHLYQSVLLPELRTLELERTKLLRQILLSGIAALLLVVITFLLAIRLSRGGVCLWLFAGLALMLLFFRGQNRLMLFRQSFKRKIIRHLLNLFPSSFSYFPEQSIPREIFETSGLFLRSIDRYHGEDLITGTCGKTSFSLSEVHAQEKVVVRTRYGTYTCYQTVFRGLFFVADFNKSFRGRTLVLPDTAEKIFGHLAQTAQSLNIFRGQLVKLEDPEFEREFVVYGTDQVEARYVLSTSLMRRILEFKKARKEELYLSFFSSRVMVAIRHERPFLEPPIFSPVLDYKSICEYYQDISLCTEIIDALNLNTRIWQSETVSTQDGR